MKIEDVVGKRYPLRWKGRSRRYMIPRAPEPSSLVVDIEAQCFNWNAHGIHGNVNTWMREIEGVDVNFSKEQPTNNQRQRSEISIDTAIEFHRHFLLLGVDHYAWADLIRRGISNRSVRRFKIGYAEDFGGCLTIPYFHYGELIGLKARLLNRKTQSKYMAFRGSSFPVYNYDEKALVIVEGEFKAIALEQAGIPAMGVPSGGFTKQFVSLLVQPRYIYIRDNDAAGLMSAIHAKKLLSDRIIITSTPEEKAVDDYLASGKTSWIKMLRASLKELTVN